MFWWRRVEALSHRSGSACNRAKVGTRFAGQATRCADAALTARSGAQVLALHRVYLRHYSRDAHPSTTCGQSSVLRRKGTVERGEARAAGPLTRSAWALCAARDARRSKRKDAADRTKGSERPSVDMVD